MENYYDTNNDAVVEILAKELHEAGREAVEKGATVAADHHGEKTRTFLGWDDISENAREGRRIQARYLLRKFVVWYRYAHDIPDELGRLLRDKIA